MRVYTPQLKPKRELKSWNRQTPFLWARLVPVWVVVLYLH